MAGKFKNKKIFLMVALCFLAFTAITFWSAPDVEDREEPVISEQKNVEAEKPLIFVNEEEDAVETEIIEPVEEEKIYVFSLSYPVTGEIIQGFSGDNLVYSKTLDDWRVHNGIDIKADELERVLACERGVVEKVYEDELMGKTIIIDHQNGYKTIYSNLSSTELVNNGDEVEKGDIISGVGNTAIIESNLESHIHFQVIKDGINVDPQEHINKDQ